MKQLGIGTNAGHLEEFCQARGRSSGTVTGDVHDSLIDGWASLSFDLVNATGARIRFDTPAGGFNHYRDAEFEAFIDTTATPEPATFWLVAASVLDSVEA